MAPDAERPIRRCRITLSSLAQDFDILSDEASGFLDLDAAEVLFVTAETARELERIYESLPSSLANASDEEQRAALLSAIEQETSFGSDSDELLEADAIDRGINVRYVALPEADSRADYEDMQAFVDTVADDRLHSRLERAIHGRGAFRHFREELRDTDGGEERWHTFKRERLEERARAWLAEENIELVTE